MSDDTTQKPVNKSAHKSSDPLLSLLVLFADAVVVAKPFRTVYILNPPSFVGVKQQNLIKYHA